MAQGLNRLGPYEILGPLGAGGMGEVFRARDPRFRREVAIKVLPADLVADAELRRRFEREARAAGALNHPNILTVHDLGDDSGKPYLVSELLEGETLRAKLAKGALPVARALDWAVQIAEGLAAAHAGGIVHRDLKPENLFVTRDGRVKILDFGLARPSPLRGGDETATTTANLTESGMVLGTAGYMAPEQIRGETVDHRADLFAFGCVLYEMLAGRHAFRGDTAVQTMSAILTEDPPALAGLRAEVPEALGRLVGGCLQKDRHLRFQAARDLAITLHALGLSTATAPTGPAPAARRGRLLLGIAVLAITGAAGAWTALRLRHPVEPVYDRLTFRRGTVFGARFAPDGRTVVYTASWDGDPTRVYTTRLDSRESSPLAVPEARLLAVSSSGELAIALGPGEDAAVGNHLTLARVPLSGGAPRELAEDVLEADWSPDGSDLAIVRRAAGRLQLEYPIGHVLVSGTANLLSPRVSPRGDAVAFVQVDTRSDFTHGRIAIVDRAGRVRPLTPVWNMLQGLAWSPRGEEIWFTAADHGNAKALYAVSLRGRVRLIVRAPSGFTLHDVFHDGRMLISQEDFRLTTMALAPGSARERDLSWQESTGAADLTDDGRTLLFTEWGEAAGLQHSIGMRATDGSPVVNLGAGYAGGFSPDGRWAVAIRMEPKPHLSLLPTGAGEVRDLDPGPLRDFDWASWVPDGRRVTFMGIEPGHAARGYVQSVDGGPPRAITPEGVSGGWHLVSPDSRFLLCGDHVLYPLDGGSPVKAGGLKPDDIPVRWFPDGRSVLVRVGTALPARLERVDLDTGARRPVRDLMPSDPAGVIVIWQIFVTPDLRCYAYSFERTLSNLYVLSALR